MVEFRHRAWMREEVFAFLKDIGVGFCCVDEPPLPRLMPFAARRTSDIAYFRFHGRNKNWFGASVSERYNYLYAEEELKSFLPDLRRLARGATATYAFFNNCHDGSAAKNAMQLKGFLGITSPPRGGSGQLPLV